MPAAARAASPAAGCRPAAGEERALPSKHIALRLKRGDRLRYRSAGGGGWGDPQRRSAEALAEDREAGYGLMKANGDNGE